jgi:hypothetical protein
VDGEAPPPDSPASRLEASPSDDQLPGGASFPFWAASPRGQPLRASLRDAKATNQTAAKPFPGRVPHMKGTPREAYRDH